MNSKQASKHARKQAKRRDGDDDGDDVDEKESPGSRWMSKHWVPPLQADAEGGDGHPSPRGALVLSPQQHQRRGNIHTHTERGCEEVEEESEREME